MKLHLGCGQRYFEGYINIDFPLSEHSVQKKSVADQFANLLDLKYAPGTVDEVRLHHVFEHFSRPVAYALLTNWFFWLRKNGVLRIEVPDFEKTAKAALSPFSSKKQKSVALRHIFGSQEAHWAVHFEGYTAKSLSALLYSFGFEKSEIIRNSWKGTYNIEIIAEKTADEKPLTYFQNETYLHLRNFLVDTGDSEHELLATWMDIYKKHVNA